MFSRFLPLVLFLIQLVVLYFVSRYSINQIFNFLRLYFKSDKIVFSLVSLFFLPGTIIHELSHFLVAGVLLLKVHEVRVIPEFQGNQIRLGRVLYEKKDIFRGILVGIAPFFAGILFFWMMANFKLFPSHNLWLNILLAYFIFSVSSTMFSSKQDLIDLIYIIPILIIVAGVIYIFDIKLNLLLDNQFFQKNVLNFINLVNSYLLFSIAINFGLSLILKGFIAVFKK